jgi:hypothetical protein
MDLLSYSFFKPTFFRRFATNCSSSSEHKRLIGSMILKPENCFAIFKTISRNPRIPDTKRQKGPTGAAPMKGLFTPANYEPKRGVKLGDTFG